MDKLFTSPVFAGAYIADFETAKGVHLLSIDYASGEVRFSLIAEDDSISGVVNGVVIEQVTEETVADEIREIVAATNS